jgi:predicted alpha-1,2-mannosidase
MRTREPRLLGPLLVTLPLLFAAAACGDDSGPPGDAGVDGGGDGSLTYPETPYDAVDVFVGTGALGAGVGACYPGASRPFSLVKLSPDTSTTAGGMVQFHHYSGYFYDDSTIVGFSHTHLSGIGVPGYSNVRVMPTTGWSPEKAGPLNARQRYVKASEEGAPGFYAVTLEDGIRAELTVGERTGYHRYTWPAGTADGDAVVVLHATATLVFGEPLAGQITIDATESRVHGWGLVDDQQGGIFRIWFDAQLDRPPVGFGVWADDVLTAGETASGTDVGAWVAFDAAEPVNVHVGLSWVDAAGARGNRLDDAARAEGQGAAHDQAKAAWERVLGRIEVEGGSALRQRIFYSALYHAYLHPTRFSDADGRYTGLDGQIHDDEGQPYYTDFSLWDTYRTLHPLLALLEPGITADMAQSLVRMADQWGGLPRWPMATAEAGSMVGSPASIVLAEAYLKGIHGFDVEGAWAHLLAQATGPVPAGSRSGIQEYLDLGYVAADRDGGSVSKTQEYNWADFAIANLGEALGHTSEAQALRLQSRSSTALWDDAVGFFRGRNADGTWDPSFNEERWEDYYVEGNAHQHLWLTPYPDVLAEVMGGRAGALERLATFFEQSREHWDCCDLGLWAPGPFYWHGNEPDLHAVYTFALLGRPSDTQRWIPWVRDIHYDLDPEGLPGNDDVGTLSAWYVFTALGLYPWAGSDLYVLGTPAFSRAVIHLDQGDLIIEATGLSAGPYVQGVTLDGVPLDRPWLRHVEIAAGGTLAFSLGAAPSTWGETETNPL